MKFAKSPEGDLACSTLTIRNSLAPSDGLRLPILSRKDAVLWYDLLHGTAG